MGLGIFTPRNPFQEVFYKRQFNAIMVGLKGAGKSTILSKLNLATVEVIRLIGF
jgi:signal recognition particle GTPase